MDAKFKARIMKALRRLHHTWSPRNQAKAKAKVDAALYMCQCGCKVLCYEGTSEKNFLELCEKYKGQTILREKGDIDHIDPVMKIDAKRFSWDTVINRMFTEVDNYQYLAKPCHKVKSKAENQLRRK